MGLLRGLRVGMFLTDGMGLRLGLGLEREIAVRVSVGNLGIDGQVVVLLVLAAAVHAL